MNNAPLGRSWRDIPQQVKPRAMSDGGRRRLAVSSLRVGVAVALLAVVGWGGLTVARIVREGPKTVPGQTEAAPVKDIVLSTDGVLNREWIVRTLALPKNATLMGLDLYKLQALVLQTSQVRTASLTRNFPSTLTVSITERMPVARLMARMGAEEPRLLLVARDGVVFEGIGYNATLTDTIPWLDGVKLSRQDGALLPIAGMETVADLLAKARLEAEHLYRTWEVVSLARLESDGEIEVRTEEVPRIMFGTQENFFPQLARLDALLDAAREQTTTPLREINLAIGAHVPVAFFGLSAPPPDTVRGERTSPAAKPLVSPAFLKTQRKTNL